MNMFRETLGPTPTAEIIATMLDELSETMGDMAEEMIFELAPMFLEDAPMLMEDLRRAIASQDATAVQQSAHTLKGSSGSMGIMKLSSLLKDMEAIGRHGNLEAAGHKMEQIEAEYEQVRRVLQQYAS
ncbi:MAG: Hpt domain-containing protein [Anaerolineae bacterium]